MDPLLVEAGSIAGLLTTEEHATAARLVMAHGCAPDAENIAHALAGESWHAVVAPTEGDSPECMDALGRGLLTVSDHIDSMSRAEVAQVHDLIRRVERCRACRSRRRVLALRRPLSRRLAAIPVDVPNTQQLRFRHADFAEAGTIADIRNVGVELSNYHNCKYRSTRRWRSFRAASAGDYQGLHIYCSRGTASCDRLHAALLSGGARLSGIQVRYPRRNRICEESQAELLSWSP